MTTDQESALSDLQHMRAKQFGEAYSAFQFLVSLNPDLAEAKAARDEKYLKGFAGKEAVCFIFVCSTELPATSTSLMQGD